MFKIFLLKNQFLKNVQLSVKLVLKVKMNV